MGLEHLVWYFEVVGISFDTKARYYCIVTDRPTDVSTKLPAKKRPLKDPPGAGY